MKRKPKPKPDFVSGLTPEMNDRVAAKIALFRSIYLPYTRHVQFHSLCDYLQKLGVLNRGRPQMGLRVLAPSGSGKSAAALAYLSEVARARPSTRDFIPILYVPLDSATTSKRLMVQILQALGDPLSDRGSEQTLRYRVAEYMRRLGVELLIIDEVQHLNFRSSAANDVTDALKSFLDAGVAPIVFLGTEEAEPMFKRNLQLNGRLLAPFDMPPLDVSKVEDRSLFASYVAGLSEALLEREVLDDVAELTNPIVLGCLMEVSKGVVGRVSRLFEAAVEITLRRGENRLEIQDLSQAVDSWAVSQNFAGRNPFLHLGGEL